MQRGLTNLMKVLFVDGTIVRPSSAKSVTTSTRIPSAADSQVVAAKFYMESWRRSCLHG